MGENSLARWFQDKWATTALEAHLGTLGSKQSKEFYLAGM